MRYGIALIVASLIIAAGAMYSHLTRQAIEQRFRRAMREAKAAGKLPPQIDAEKANSADFAIELPTSEIRRIRIANAFTTHRFILIGTVLLVSLGVARMLDRNKPVTEAPRTTSGP